LRHHLRNSVALNGSVGKPLYTSPNQGVTANLTGYRWQVGISFTGF
jgi:hypothetical protein